MTTFEIILLVMIVLLVGIFIGGYISNTVLNHKRFEEEKEMNDHQYRILDASIEIDFNNIISTFEAFIALQMEEYLQINFNYKDISFINSEMEEELLRNISKKVMTSISPFMISKLSLIYHIQSEDDLADLITTRTYIQVLKYVIEMNSIKNGNETPNISLIDKK